MSKRSFVKLMLGGAMLPAAAALMLNAGPAWAQNPSEVKVGLLVPLSGIYARPGAVMRMGAEMAIEDINAQGGIKALGGAKLQLVVLDSGDTTEKAKNAAQRMVAQEADLVAATGAYLSSFTLAVTEVTERANLPVLTLSYSDMITERGFKYVGLTGRTIAARAGEAGRDRHWQQAEDGGYHHRQHRGLDLLGETDERAAVEGARHSACRRRDFHAAPRRCHATGSESACCAS